MADAMDMRSRVMGIADILSRDGAVVTTDDIYTILQESDLRRFPTRWQIGRFLAEWRALHG